MICFLGLGSNLGDKQSNLQKAIADIAERIGILSAMSSMYETKPWGFSSHHTFLNQVVCVDTILTPEEILKESKAIEKGIGRLKKTGNRYEDRLIDIDILFYGNLILNTEELTLPHPLLHERAFVLKGLNELAPELVHPVLKQSVSTLYSSMLRQ